MATIEERFAALDQKILVLDALANDIQEQLKNPQPQQRQPRLPKQSKAAPPAPKPSQGGSKVAYVYDADAVAARYIHDEHFPPNMICDPTINYQNSMTNTDKDIANAGSENEKTIRQYAKDAKLYTSVFYRAPGDYYDWTLQKRRDLLGAPSVHYLCKAMVMKNSKCPHDNFDNKLDSKYYMAIIQYSARLHNERLAHAIRRQQPPEARVPINKINFRWVDPEVSNELTGYSHNGVTPINCKSKIPIVLSHKIAELPLGMFWFGGGEVDLKYRMSVAEFVSHFAENIIIDDITYDEPTQDDDGPL